MATEECYLGLTSDMYKHTRARTHTHTHTHTRTRHYGCRPVILVIPVLRGQRELIPEAGWLG